MLRGRYSAIMLGQGIGMLRKVKHRIAGTVDTDAEGKVKHRIVETGKRDAEGKAKHRNAGTWDKDAEGR